MLVFDADDTLWENNVRFERVVDDFVAWLARPTLDDAKIRAILRDIETANTVTHGYGSRVFLRTLRDCFERLHARPASDREQQQIADLALDLMEHRVELMPGVAGTVDELGRRHELALLTKGDPDEQQGKLDASGLTRFFGSIHIVDRKSVDTYRRLTRQLALRPGSTWMIGNSAKSDIIPARQAGWNAVFIPHAHTWALEHDEFDPDDNILQLRSFTDLLNHF